jgi:hypothetical protein
VNLILVTTSDAAVLFQVPTGTLHRWAHEDVWTRYGTRRTRAWNIDDVQASHDRRRAADDSDR